MPGVHVQYAELFVLWRKAPNNYHHNTTVAYQPFSLDTPDWWCSISSILYIRLRDTCSSEDTTHPIHIRRHAGASTTTAPSAAAYAWRRWWYACSLPSITIAVTNDV